MNEQNMKERRRKNKKVCGTKLCVKGEKACVRVTRQKHVSTYSLYVEYFINILSHIFNLVPKVEGQSRHVFLARYHIRIAEVPSQTGNKTPHALVFDTAPT